MCPVACRFEFDSLIEKASSIIGAIAKARSCPAQPIRCAERYPSPARPPRLLGDGTARFAVDTTARDSDPVSIRWPAAYDPVRDWQSRSPPTSTLHPWLGECP